MDPERFERILETMRAIVACYVEPESPVLRVAFPTRNAPVAVRTRARRATG